MSSATVTDAPLSRLSEEAYNDRAAVAEHERQDHIQHCLPEREPLLRDHRVDLTPSGSA